MQRWYVPGLIKLPFLKKKSDGPWVLYRDVEPVIQQVADLQKQLDEATDIINFGAEVWVGKWKDRAKTWLENNENV